VMGEFMRVEGLYSWKGEGTQAEHHTDQRPHEGHGVREGKAGRMKDVKNQGGLRFSLLNILGPRRKLHTHQRCFLSEPLQRKPCQAKPPTEHKHSHTRVHCKRECIHFY
jgi:hypothetical protein